MPGKGAAARRRAEKPSTGEPGPSEGPSFRRPDPDTVRRVARRALARGPAYPSQAALRRELLPLLRAEDPLFRLGGRRLRALLIEAPGVELRVRYAERTDRRPLTRCPVCGAALGPIRNRTLLGDRVTLGYRCPRCGYWTHLKRRVPTRYQFIAVGGRARGSSAR